MKTGEFFRRVRYVTLKLTRGCNLKCTYCNVDAFTPKTPRMSLEQFQLIARLLIENSTAPFVGLEFHGGEPMLLSDEFYEEATKYAMALARKHNKFVEFPLVTNGTLLTEERLLKLSKLGIKFCISADGPPEINDVLRGKGKAVEAAIRLFQKNKISFGCLSVLSKANYGRMYEVMEWFKEMNIRDFRLNFLQPQGRGADESFLLSGEEMFEGIRGVMDHMVQTDVSVREEETLLNVDRFLHGRSANPGLSCWEHQCQAGRNYVAIDHEGTIHACGTDMSNHPLGKIEAEEFDEVHYDNTLRALHHKGDWVIRCFDCDAKQICRHSCSTSDYNSDNYKEYECAYTKLLWNHMCEFPYKPERIRGIIQQRNGSRGRGQFVPLSPLSAS